MNRRRSRLNLLVLRSQDIDRLSKFYTLLGMNFERHRHGAGPEHYSSEDAGIVLEIYPTKHDDRGSSPLRFGFSVDGIDALHAELLDAGASEVVPPSDSEWERRSVVDDPDGHRLELVQGEH